MVKLRQANKSELEEGMVIYFEYEHNYNSRSRAIRYKRELFLREHNGKAVVILQGLHGVTWNKTTTTCDFDRIHIESYIGTGYFPDKLLEAKDFSKGGKE